MRSGQRFLRELESVGGGDQAEKLSSLVRLTINGVAAGLQNTG
jgi:phosphoenolpyruvate carboxylase